MQKLGWIKQLSMVSCFWVQFIKISVSSIFCILLFHLGNDEESLFYNYKTSDFDVICHNIVWNSENVLSGVIWAFLDLTVDRSWVAEYRSGIFFLYIPCHSRHRVYLQCHCQLKLKTGGRCNDAERRANIISFSSKTHIDNQFLLWGLPEKCLPLWASVSPIQENPGTGRGKCNAEIRHQLSLWSTNKILARW